MKYTWIALRSGHTIKVSTDIEIKFDDKGWSNTFKGELYGSDTQRICGSDTIHFRREDAVLYT